MITKSNYKKISIWSIILSLIYVSPGAILEILDEGISNGLLVDRFLGLILISIPVFCWISSIVNSINFDPKEKASTHYTVSVVWAIVPVLMFSLIDILSPHGEFSGLISFFGILYVVPILFVASLLFTAFIRFIKNQ